MAVPAVTHNDLHFKRYFMHKHGMPIEDIASHSQVSKKTIETSIRAVEMYISMHQIDQVRLTQAKMVVNLSKKQEKALSEALEAMVEETDENGKVQKTPDHTIRLKAVSEVREIAKNVEPPPPPSKTIIEGHKTQVNIGASQTSGIALAGTRDFEQQLRDIQEKRKRLLTNGEPESSEVKVIDALSMP
jgi:hypothetical protein